MKKSKRMMGLLAALVLLMSIVLFPVSHVHAETSALGTHLSSIIISQDTVWTKENSPYFLNGKVQIAYGASLTIEPGVTLKGDGGSFDVWGDLDMQGSADEMIFMDGIHINPYGKSNQVASINMDYVYMYGGTMTNYSISGANAGYHLTNSIFEGTGQLEIDYPDVDSVVTHNIFSRSAGLDIGSFSSHTLDIKNNLFYKQPYSSSYLIESMYSIGDKTVFEKNSFVDIAKIIKMPSSSTAFNFNAKNNYWGSANPDDFTDKFYDMNDNLASSGYVLYEPYLAEPDSATPKVEDVLPIPPRVYNEEEFNDDLDMLEGKSDPEADIFIQNGSKTIGQGKASGDGSFTLSFDPQPAGSLLTLYSKNTRGQKSMTTVLVVQAAPMAPPSVPAITTPDKVTEKTEVIAGKTDPRAVVYIRNKGELIGKGQADLKGNFSIKIAPQPAWSELVLTAENVKNLVSSPLKVTVSDITKPTVPVVNPVINSDVKVTGTAEPGSMIKIRIQGTGEERDSFVEGITDENGYFEVPIEKQRPLTFLFVHAEDKTGNKSDETFLAVSDGVAPVWNDQTPITIKDISYDFVSFSISKASDDVTLGNEIFYNVYLNDSQGAYLSLQDKDTARLSLESDKEYKLSIVVTDGNQNRSIPKTITFRTLTRPWGFGDVSVYKDEINYLAAKKIITGYQDGTFKPGNEIKRLQAVQMILREKGIDVDKISNVKDPHFTDVKPGAYGYKEVAVAVEKGFISGKTNPKTGQKYFDLWASLTRAQMAKILATAYPLEKPVQGAIFSDVPQGFWGKDYINSLYATGITTGYQDGTFKPNLSISRQHFSLFLARYLNEEFRDMGTGSSSQ